MKRARPIVAAAVAALIFLAGTMAMVEAGEAVVEGGGSNGVRPGGDVGPAAEGSGPGVEYTERISIPFGISHTLPLRNSGQQVVVIGHGSCSAGETVTVLISVTQSVSGATAGGQSSEDCAGEADLQVWSLPATASGAPLTAGPAVVCGLATTFDGETETDSFAWCRPDVTLAWLHHLPIIFGENSANNG